MSNKHENKTGAVGGFVYDKVTNGGEANTIYETGAQAENPMADAFDAAGAGGNEPEVDLQSAELIKVLKEKGIASKEELDAHIKDIYNKARAYRPEEYKAEVKTDVNEFKKIDKITGGNKTMEIRNEALTEGVRFKVSEETIGKFILAKVEEQIGKEAGATIVWKNWDNNRIAKIVKSVDTKISNDPNLNNDIIRYLQSRVNTGNKLLRVPFIAVPKQSSLVSVKQKHFLLDHLNINNDMTTINTLKDSLTAFVAKAKYAQDKPSIVLFDEEEADNGFIYAFVNSLEVMTAITSNYLEVGVADVVRQFNIAFESSKADAAVRIKAERKAL